MTAAIVVTVGEPAGIGPDLAVRLAERSWPARLVLAGDRELLRERARRLGAGVHLIPYRREAGAQPGALEVLHFPVAVGVEPGRLDRGNAKTVIASLDAAVSGCIGGEFAAMVTAPVQKSVINDAGIPFTGHTEFLAQRTGAARVVMMLVGTGQPPLRVALATTHLPLAAVPAAITRERLEQTLIVTASDLDRRFGIAKPRIAVCGLNPHAGEGGYLGREEIDVIAPVLAGLRGQGIDVVGPLPADTVFVPVKASQFDCVVAMYHDQGLPVVKHASFGHGVNVTLGLPIVRTSVDHGTALDIAADGALARAADPGSLFAAVALAIELAARAPGRRR
ncbi:MAG TPA: 4-hydroxythreonine-4-phosphate dehydrogenase PdxA [Casimicrobiaceae bacterium]|nr:4-hydroxythreonine-4-phosphate dehydrogenase PdxA [Casimicrobiaceae bacterium]